MRVTKRQLKRIIRNVISESKYPWMDRGNKKGFPFTDDQWRATDQAEKDAYMDFSFPDDGDIARGSAGDADYEEYSEARVNRMVEFLRNNRVGGDPFHTLSGRFADASEEEIADAMDQV